MEEKRVKKLQEYCTKLCSIIPFEQELYSKKDMISYVGHPLLDEITEFKHEYKQTNKIVFMPGSRKTEITKHMPIFRQIAKDLPNKQHILIIPSKFDEMYVKKTYGDTSDFIISNDAHQSLIDAEFGFICSGTATLEASLIGTPFVMSYVAKKLDYFIGKMFVKLPYIGLANIFFDKMGKNAIHKEFFQEDVTTKNLLAEYKNMDKKQFLNNSKVLRDYLQNGSSKNVAQIIQN